MNSQFHKLLKKIFTIGLPIVVTAPHHFEKHYTIFPQSQKLANTGEFIEIETMFADNIKLACYFTNVDGNGELETVLKAIKAQESPHADCLINWKNCIANRGKQISDKNFDKFWVSIYLRYDTCSRKEQKQAERKCSLEYSMKEKKTIWNFTDPFLDDVKEFLNLFAQSN